MPILLKLPTATVSRLDPEVDESVLIDQGQLTVSTLDAESTYGRGDDGEKLILLTINTFQYRLTPSLTLSHSPALNTYTLPPPHQAPHPPIHHALIISIPFPSSSSSLDETAQSTFHALLSSYLTLREHNPEGVEGKVLLIDDKGGIVGEMEAEAQLGELDGKEKGPVILDVEAGVQPGNTVKVTEVPADEMDDWLLSGASRLSKGLLSGSAFVSEKLNKASANFIATAQPRAEPIKVGDGTLNGIRKVNAATTTVRSSVSKTTGFLNRQIQRGVEYTVEKGTAGTTSAAQLAQQKQREFEIRRAAQLGRPRPPSPPPKPASLASNKRPLISRLLLAGDVLLTSVESSATTIVSSASTSTTAAITHKYGAEAGQASAQAGGSVVNVTMAVVNARGVGRSALIKGAGKGLIKTRMKTESGKTYGVQKEAELVEQLNSDGKTNQNPPAKSYFTSSSASSPGTSSPYASDQKTLPPPSSSSPKPTFPAAPLAPTRAPQRQPSPNISAASSLRSSNNTSPQPSFYSARSTASSFAPTVTPAAHRSMPPAPSSNFSPRGQASGGTGWARPPPPSEDDFSAENTRDSLGGRMGGLSVSGSSPSGKSNGGEGERVSLGWSNESPTSAPDSATTAAPPPYVKRRIPSAVGKWD